MDITTDIITDITADIATDTAMEDPESAEERCKRAPDNSRVAELIDSANQATDSPLEANENAEEDNELFVPEEPAPKRPRRTPVLPILSNREIRQSILVCLNGAGSSSGASGFNNINRLTASKLQSQSKRKKKSKANEIDLATLLNSDIIKDGQSNAQSAPVHASTLGNKDKALSELLASIPTENRGEAKPDKQAVIEATKKLPRVRYDGKGGWKHPDLTTSLYHHQVRLRSDIWRSIANIRIRF